MTRTTLKIDGMSCGHCAATVKRALESVDGVAVAQVSAGSATVEFDPALASVDQLAHAVDKAGYTATAVA